MLRAKTQATFRRKHRGKFSYLRLGNSFLAMTPKAQVTKEKTDKLDIS